MSNDIQDTWIQEFLTQSGIYAEPKQGELYQEIFQRLLSRVERLETILLADALQRLDHPALQDAWDKYQTIKKLTEK